MNVPRYKNIFPEPTFLEYYEPIVKRHLENGVVDDSFGDNDPIQRSADLVGEKYCRGYPLSEVWQSLGAAIDILLKAVDAFLENPSEETAKKCGFVGGHYASLIGYCLLLQDDNRTEIVYERVDKSLETAAHVDFFWDFVRFCKALAAGAPNVEELADRCEKTESQRTGNEFKIFSDDRLLLLVARKSESEFATDFKRELRSMCGSPRARFRQELTPCSKHFSLYCLVPLAYALNAGFSLPIVDTAIPIWDFPLGRKLGIEAPES